jgi:pimeloyl-ACP methyl ester carboxylesterase
VFTYDRRGRGDSRDAQPYAVQREIEDLEAVIDVGGESAYVYGVSSGAGLALETACAVPAKVSKLAFTSRHSSSTTPARRFPPMRSGR